MAADLPELDIIAVTRCSEDDWGVEVDAGDMDPHMVLGMLVMGVLTQVGYLQGEEPAEDEEGEGRMNEDHVVRACKAYIREKKATLWMIWNVSDPEGLQAAAEWLAEAVKDVEYRVFDEQYADRAAGNLQVH